MDSGGCYVHYPATGTTAPATSITTSSSERIVFVGLGPADEVTLENIQAATIRAVNEARARKLQSLALEIPNHSVNISHSTFCPNSLFASNTNIAQTIARVAHLSNYAFQRYEKVKDSPPLNKILVVGEKAQERDDVEEAVIMADATTWARDIANLRGDECTPDKFEEAVKNVLTLSTSSTISLTLEVLNVEDLKSKGMDLLCAVGQAANSSPRLLILRYTGDPLHPENTVALVGKGVTFDTGGLNLKSTGAIEGMHMDMAGAAAVAATMLSLPRLATLAHSAGKNNPYNRNIIGVIPLAENAIGPSAMKPLAIVKSLKGDTVEIGNTDAEGRLVLADALTYIQRDCKHKITDIVDLATLTGACVVALGEYSAGLFANHSKIQQELIQAGAQSLERVWPMPILKEHCDELKPRNRHATLRSTGKSRLGGASIGAGFLKHFIEPLASLKPDSAASSTDEINNENKKEKKVYPRWAHLDIAGPAMYSEPRGFNPQGGTGFGAALLLTWLKGK